MRHPLMIAFALILNPLHATPLCTLARTYLAPAKGNPCFEQLMTKAKSPTDRKWLLDVSRTWAPPGDLTVLEIPGGFKLSRGAKALGSVQWLTNDPPIIYLNGQFRYGQLSPDGAKSTVIHRMFAETKSAFLFSPFAVAHAAEANAALMENMTTLFSIGGTGQTADQVISSDMFYGVTLPRVGMLASWTGGKGVQCTKGGVGALKLPFASDDLMNQPGKSPAYTLTSIGKGEFSAEGVVPGQKIILKLRESARGVPCVNLSSRALDQKYCNPAWERFFAREPKAKQEFVKNGESALSCPSQSPQFRAKCEAFFKTQFINFSEGEGPELSLCQDDGCRARRPIALKELGELTSTEADRSAKAKAFRDQRQAQVDKYVEFLKSNGIDSAESACLDLKCREPIDVGRLSAAKIAEARSLKPGLVNETDDGSVIQRILARGALGAAVLAECCTSASCRDVAYKKLSLDLKPDPATTGATK